MTSNLGSKAIAEQQGDRAAQEQAVNEALRGHFKPEFLNRVDDIIIFQPLGETEIEKIVKIQLNRAQQRLAEKKITLEPTKTALKSLAEAGYDPIFGARPLKRLIQTSILDPLALKLIEGQVQSGDTIVIDQKNNQLVLTKK